MLILFRLLFIFIIGIGSVTSLLPQELKLSGQVKDDVTVLPFANITVNPGNINTTTDHQGNFAVLLSKMGTYNISITYVGYESLHQMIAINKEDTHLDFNLNPSVLIDEIVVTGTMRPTFVSASPIKVDVITSKKLDNYIPAAGSSLIEGIKMVNGVQETTSCGVCYTNSISINGLEGAYTAVLIDGIPMYGNLASVYGLNGIPNVIIDRIELIKGPNSTLYGSEAVAGVINVITKDPSQEPDATVDLMATTHRESFGNIAFTPQFGQANGYIGLNYAYGNNFDDNNHDGFGDGIAIDRYSFFTKWEFGRKNKRSLQIAAKLYYEDRRNGVEAYLKGRAYKKIRGSSTIYGESIYTKRASIFGTYTFYNQKDFQVDFSLSHHDQNSYYGADFYQANQNIGFANFTWNKEIRRHKLLVGLTQRYNAYDDNTVATSDLDDHGLEINQPDNQYIDFVITGIITYLGDTIVYIYA